jgi:tetratricopeptide (TPR) repeat protein
VNRPCLFVCFPGLLLLSTFLLPTCSLAQQGPGGLGGFIGVQSINTTTISVQVRGADGSKLSSMAIVNLHNLMGQMVSSQTTFGSQTVFQIGAGEYVIEVEAFGYEKARVQAEVSSAKPQQVVVVKLKPENSNGLNYVAPVGVALSTKAQKELAKGVENYQSNKLDEAIKYLETAHQLAPAHPDIVYLLGETYEKKGDVPAARKYWDQAIQLSPGHVSSLLACGESYLRQNNAEEARKYLDKAVEVAPNSWRAHSLLANALLRQNSYAEAVTHAQRAVELDKGQANSSLLILGQALAAEHQNEQAIAALKDYLAGKPPETQAQAVVKLIARLKDAPAAPAGATVGGVTTSYETGALASDVPDLPLTAAALHWLPPNVDDAVPPVEPGVACSAEDILKNASARVQELPAVVDRYTATEVLHHEDVNTAGYADRIEDLSFNYLASVREIKNKYGQSIDVQEYRNGSTGTEMFPNQMASVGLPSIVLIFHPILISDFDMKCEGLSRAHGNFAWQVYFAQRENTESRIRRYRMGGHVFPIALKGRAWIDANTFQIVRLETDLREAHPELRLNAEHLVMEYGPVKFKSRNEELWLPASADYYAVLRGHRFHRRHSFTDYVLFSIDDKQKIGDVPKDKIAADNPSEKKTSN